MITGTNTAVKGELSKVTEEYIFSRISSTHFFQPFNGSTMTICNIVLDNGFSVIGESACVDPANFKTDKGEKLAYDKAFDNLWPLFGFLLAEQRKEQGIELKSVDYSPAITSPVDDEIQGFTDDSFDVEKK